MKELGCRERNLYTSIVAPSPSSLPPSKSMTEQPSAMCIVNVRVGLQQKRRERKKERKKGRAVGEEKKLLKTTTTKKLETELEEGEIYGGRLLLHSAAPREAKEEGWGGERGKNIPFSPSSSLALQKPHRGWRALSPCEQSREMLVLYGNVEFN